MTTDDVIGDGKIDLFNFGKDEKVKIFFKGKEAGVISLGLEYLKSLPSVEGLLTLKVIEADIKKDTELIGKMDPFCEIFMGD